MAVQRIPVRRYLIFGGIVLVVWFAVQGGEYSTTALFKQRSRERVLRESVDVLTREVDSLRALRKSIQSDPALQERIAREDHGLVRGDKEILYRFIDTSVSKP